MKKKRTILLLSILTTMSIAFTAFAADLQYNISAINLSITVPDGLNALTRNVSEGNPALSILDAKPEELMAVYQQKGIYLDLFPNDLTYEIVLVATKVQDKDFEMLSEAELEDYKNTLLKDYETMENETLLSVSQYESNGTNYLVTSSVFEDTAFSSHAVKYYTVKNGIGYHYILQTNQTELTAEHTKQIESLLSTAQYQHVKGSLWESPFFTTIFETLVGGGLSIALLLLIIFLLNRSTKKKIGE